MSDERPAQASARGSDPEFDPGTVQEPVTDAEATSPERTDADQARATADAVGELSLSGAWGRAVRAGAGGEALSGKGVLSAIGGWRGVSETLLPGMLFLVMFTVTRDARIAAIGPAILALIAIVIRLVRREPVTSALSGAIGVGIAVAATLFTGRGSNYYVPGFWTNGLWSAGLLLSILIGWPLLGLAIGAFRGDLVGWRKDRRLKRVGTGLTVLWLGLFLARLAVQLPLWFAAQSASEGTDAGNAATDALGVARLVMGVPLFALAVVFTWMVLSKVSAESRASDREDEADSGGEAQAESGVNAESDTPEADSTQSSDE